jgi:hypothetical protein
MGSLACYMLGYRSYASYKVSRNELSAYLAWFGLLMGLGQSILAVPGFMTSDPSTIRTTYLIAELFIYSSMAAQAAVLWCLLLRSRIPRFYALAPVVAVGAAAWLYAIPRSTLRFTADNFIEYRDPLFSTIVIGVFLIALFLPVGIYFLRSASRQEGTKAILTSLSLGLVYVGVGLFTGGIELLAGQVITPRSAVFDLAFFFVLFSVLLWPHRAVAKAPALR